MTSFSSYELQQLKAAGGDDFIVFNGPDQQYFVRWSYGSMRWNRRSRHDAELYRDWKFASNSKGSWKRKIGVSLKTERDYHGRYREC